MGRSAIRTGQLISTFGPGGLVVDRYGTSLLICGLDHWYYREPEPDGVSQQADKIEEFRFNEWRLEQSLDMKFFMQPPDYRIPQRSNQGSSQTPNVNLHIPALRFPSYFVCSNSRCKAMRKAEYHLGERPKCREHQGYGRMNQVRFISVCPKGHIDDFPWRQLVGCVRGDECPGRLSMNEQGSSDLASIKISCTCGKSGNLGNVTSFDRLEDGTIVSQLTRRIVESTGSESAGRCRGRCLWHGPNHYEECGDDIIATFPNATNVYHARTRTSIFIPVRSLADGEVESIVRLLESSTDYQTIVKTMWGLNKSMAIKHLNGIIEDHADMFGDIEKAKGQSESALEQFFSGVPVLQDDAETPSELESEETAFRRVEFNVLRKAADERDLRTEVVSVPKTLSNVISRIVKVERLRETRILHGFDRFSPRQESGSPGEIGDRAIRQLFAHPPSNRWLPGTVVFGEGIYFELNEDTLKQWQRDQHEWLVDRLYGDHNFAGRMPWSDFKIAPVGEVKIEWISRYLLVHTTAHIVINRLVFECGYSTASLRERLYVSADSAAPQAGILIYTSAGDSEGTLGGLVRLADADRFSGVIQRACDRASWCSADPVCSEVTNAYDYNLAACHSCVLLPETSCENFNKALDRAIVIGSPRDPTCGFFSGLQTSSERVTVS